VYASRGEPNAYAGDNASYFAIGLYVSGGWQANASNPVALLFGPVSAAQR